jgi:3-deoxy-D-manno-octulosonic-acid transferase
MQFLYSSALALALLIGLPFWLVQMLRSGKYRAGLSERLGRISRRLRATAIGENCIWIHAVSVGEVLAITRLVQELRTKFPGWRIVVSTTTRTGQALARTRFGEENVFYLPLDFKSFLRSHFRHLRPRLLVMAESEFWLNLLAVARESGCRTAVVNARISDRSLPRYLRIRSLLARYTLSNVDVFLAQSPLDADRLKQIGAPEGRVQVSGNLKFDVAPPSENDLVRKLRAALPSGIGVIVCGSTVEGEEELMLPALSAVLAQDALVILAPRHPERFDSVASLLERTTFKVIRRSRWRGEPISRGSIFLLDTIGELAGAYALADVAFVGGSLVPRGGHNILEPAYFGKAIVVGPHTENFRDIVQRFAAEHAVLTATPQELEGTLVRLLSDSQDRDQLASRARSVMAANSGATEKTLAALEVLLWMPESLRLQIAGNKR